MEVILSTLQVDVQECEILVLGFFEDERPLRGSSGWLDWRLNGILSRCLTEKRLIGTWKEATLIPSQGRILPSLILLVGLGKAREYSYLRLRELFPFLLETLKKLDVSKICVSLPEDEEHQVEPGKLAEVLMEGIADSMDETTVPGREDWIKGLQLFFAEGEERFSEILLGVQTAQSILEDRLNIRILVPSEGPFNSSTMQKQPIQKDLTFSR
ncbi:MAG: hypothetical protein A2157_05155 [Deltaproteobacteria bacterium RBG_16_47_11]|nr:MAG: hypothetical protein A2157_05155 [Deltaproteobacteria bacterium RBG_16_47_11]